MPLPQIVEYKPEISVVTVKFKDQQRQLEARALTDGKVMVSGFAAAFTNGNRVWDAYVIFKKNHLGALSYEETRVANFNPGRAGDPPHVVGFISDCKRQNIGTPQGQRRDWYP